MAGDGTGQGGEDSSTPLQTDVGQGASHAAATNATYHPTPSPPRGTKGSITPLQATQAPCGWQLHGLLTGCTQLAGHEACQQPSEPHI